MIKKLFIMMSVVLALCGCAQENRNTNKSISINPLGEAAAKDTISAVLYFACQDGNHIAGETIQFKSPLNERVETALIESLIKGPSSISKLNPVINPDTEIISIDVQNDIFIVAFSADFLRSPNVKLAASATANTLIHYGGYKRVQIMIADEPESAVRRITLEEYGEDGTGFVDALGYDFDAVITPKNTILAIFELLETCSYADIFGYILADENTPSEQEFADMLKNAQPRVTDYSVNGCVENASSAMVFADFSLTTGSGRAFFESNIPINTRLDNSLWKIEWQEFKKIFIPSEN